MVRRSFVAVMAFVGVVSSVSAALASPIITVEILDTTSIALSLSGTLDGPAPGINAGVLFLDTTVPASVTANYATITGDAMIGTLSLHSVFSGYDVAPYGGVLQLRGSVNGETPFAVGDVLSGNATVTFNVAHGMTQAMFDAGVPIYWGRAQGLGFGTLQGTATSVNGTTVPEPATMMLLGPAVAALVLRRRFKRA